MLQNIFLVALSYNINIKEFGLNPVLEVIINDIKILEEQEIFIESLNTYMKGTLISLSCDNLAGAILLGMNESFNSHHYYKICTMHKEHVQKAVLQIQVYYEQQKIYHINETMQIAIQLIFLK